MGRRTGEGLRQPGQPCCISQAALCDAGSKVGARKEAPPPEAQQLLCWTQKDEPDTSTLARDALRQPPSSPTQGPGGLLLLGPVAHPCSPMQVRLCQLELGGGGKQAGRPEGDGKQHRWGTPERAQARGCWGLSPSAMKPPNTPCITWQTKGGLLSLESCFRETGLPLW